MDIVQESIIRIHQIVNTTDAVTFIITFVAIGIQEIYLCMYMRIAIGRVGLCHGRIQQGTHGGICSIVHVTIGCQSAVGTFRATRPDKQDVNRGNSIGRVGSSISSSGIGVCG
jgi:hypothetical protein